MQNLKEVIGESSVATNTPPVNEDNVADALNQPSPSTQPVLTIPDNKPDLMAPPADAPVQQGGENISPAMVGLVPMGTPLNDPNGN